MVAKESPDKLLLAINVVVRIIYRASYSELTRTLSNTRANSTNINHTEIERALWLKFSDLIHSHIVQPPPFDTTGE